MTGTSARPSSRDGAPAALAGDELVLAVAQAHDERLDDAVLADGIHQLRELLAREILARLQRTGHHSASGTLRTDLARRQAAGRSGSGRGGAPRAQ